MFIGRETEMRLLTDLLKKEKASFVVCRGRRRIGKSTLIQQFGKHAKTFLEFQGLPPRGGISTRDQLNSFSEQLARQTILPKLGLESWSQAFALVNSVIKSERTIVFLDEISWLAATDKDFAGQLKIAWDTQFKKHSNLILVACGSVSSWIDKNILNSAGFMGRVSLDLMLSELSLYHCVQFWKRKANRISDTEKIKVLSVTGGVPRYLEEININLSAEINIKQMCFSSEGILFSEFNRIFQDTFSRHADKYKQIVASLADGSKTLSDICTAIGITRSGNMSAHLDDLVASGFVSKDVSFAPGTNRRTRFFKYRLRDNYLRFYLKYIDPVKPAIEQGLYLDVDLQSLVNWHVIMGFQFENLVLNNLRSVCKALFIDMHTVLSASPYFQRKTQRSEACQIDLLIQTRHTIYVCEIRFREQIRSDVIQEVQEKVRKLKIPKNLSIRPVLIYVGELSSGVVNEGYFDQCINFSDLIRVH
jgi:AAA+ ATPase superfamily predicted ATPase